MRNKFEKKKHLFAVFFDNKKKIQKIIGIPDE